MKGFSYDGSTIICIITLSFLMLNTCSALNCYECNSQTHSDCDSSKKAVLGKYEVVCDPAFKYPACMVVNMDFTSMTDFGQGGYHIPKAGKGKHISFTTVRNKLMRGCVGNKGKPTKTASTRSRKRKKPKHHQHIRDVEEESEFEANDLSSLGLEVPDLLVSNMVVPDFGDNITLRNQIRRQLVVPKTADSTTVTADLAKGVAVDTPLINLKLKYGCKKLVVNFGSTRVNSCICKSDNCNSGRSISTGFSYRVMISLIAVGTILAARMY